MKNINKTLVFLFIVSLGFNACTDLSKPVIEPTGTPSVSSVSWADNDSVVTAGELGKTYILRGNHLGTLTDFYINDYKIDVNSTYVREDNFLFSISGKTPWYQQESKLRVETLGGSTTFDFTIQQPEPTIDPDLSSQEMVGSDLHLTIVGEYFHNLISVKFGNVGSQIDVPATVISSDFEEIVVAVPSSINQAGFNYSVETPGGVASSVGEIIVVLPSLLANSSFEDNDGVDFMGWSKFNGPDRMSASPEARAGLFSLKYVNPSNGDPWSTQLVSDAVTLNVGASYKLSLFVKGEVGGGKMRISTNEGTPQYFADHDITDDWTKYDILFIATDAATRIALDLGASAGTYYLDDVTLDLQ